MAAHRDKNNYLHMFDRIKALIKYKGFQAVPSELENVLTHYPLAREAAIIGIWSGREAAEVPLAYVVLDDTA